MDIGNAFTPVASDAIERVRDLANRFADASLPAVARARVLAELRVHEATLEAAFRYRLECGPAPGGADSEDYFAEKLTGMMSFARMAVEPDARGGYETDQIVENVGHYSYLVARLVCAGWTSRARRPVSDVTLKKAAFEHRDALKRLANR